MRNIKRKTKLFIIVIFSILLCFTVGIGGYMYYYLHNLSNTSKNNINLTQAKKDASVNILVMGVDIGSQLTDSIILMNYNPKIKAITLISIPRDTLITIDGKRRKINEANGIGNTAGAGNGVKYLVDAVQKTLDIDINYYGKVNYSGFIEIINAIGGVDMKINKTMNYDDASQNLHIHFKNGETVHLDGQKAMEFFRWRKNNNFEQANTGDLGRIENQHLFMAKVIEKIKSPAIVIKLPAIMDAIPKYAETNMSAKEILNYGFILSKTDSANIKTLILKGETPYIGGISYFTYDEKKNLEISKILHANGAESSDKNITFNKSGFKVQVLNCTPTVGLATKYATMITEKGYESVKTGNGKRASQSKIITYGIDSKYDSTIKSELGINNIERIVKKQGNFDIIIMLGDNYTEK